MNINPIILVLIIAAVAVIAVILLVTSGNKRKKAAEQSAPAAPAAPQPLAEMPAPAALPVNPAISPKTVAAIMAAVSMACGSPPNELRFTAIRRVSTIRNPWAAAGAADIIANRQAYL